MADEVHLFLTSGREISFYNVEDVKVQGVNGKASSPPTYHRIEFNHEGKHIEHLTNLPFLIAKIKE